MALLCEEALHLKARCNIWRAFAQPLPCLSGAPLEEGRGFRGGASDVGIVTVDDPLSNLGLVHFDKESRSGA